MGNIFLTKEQIDKLKPLSGKRSGCYGNCYEYNGQVLKIFKRNIEPSDYHNIKENLKRKSDIIMYPTDKVFLDDEKTAFKGYLCNKAPGTDLSNLILSITEGQSDILFDDFLTGYYDKFLPKLKKENVLISDVKLEHIFFKNCFYLIDTDWYTSKAKDMTVKEKDEKNISRINTYLNNFIYAFLNIEVYNNLFFDISIEEKYKDEYIDKIFDGIKKTTKGSVSSFNELLNYKFSDDKEEHMTVRKQGWL